MTANSLAYNKLLEESRANRAREYETHRANTAQEAELQRSHRASENLTMQDLIEKKRHNVQSEALAKRTTDLNYAASIYGHNAHITASQISASASRYAADRGYAASVYNANTQAATSRWNAQLQANTSLRNEQLRQNTAKQIAQLQSSTSYGVQGLKNQMTRYQTNSQLANSLTIARERNANDLAISGINLAGNSLNAVIRSQGGKK